METNTAVDAVHTDTMNDGTLVTTTWHDTKAEAMTRIASVKGATFRKVFDERKRGAILGNFRAVTWQSVQS
jgi:hypothetical protein